MQNKTFFVLPKGVEPLSSEPESDILSIELRKQLGCKNSNLNEIFKKCRYIFFRNFHKSPFLAFS